jgi:hypothetical protein
VIRRGLPAALARVVLLALLSGASGAAVAQGGAQPAGGARASSALRLATLAERIAKLHAQLGQGVLVERSRRALPEAIRDFDASLKLAAARAPTPEIRDNYVLLALLWREYRDWALKAPTRENARKLRERAEEVVWIASKGAKMLQEHSRASQSAWALRAAGAAVLSQRIPKLYLWRRWDMRDAALAKELREAEENLRRSLDALHGAPDNTPEIEAELLGAENQLRFMADAAKQFEGAAAAKRHIEFIAKTGDHILDAMERMTRFYEGAGS